MTPPPHRERGERPEREPIDPLHALERLYAKKVITLEEGQAAAKLIDPNATFPAPPKPAPPPAPTAPSAPPAAGSAAPADASADGTGANGGPEPTEHPSG